jgi:hypothetical protein
MHKTFSRSRILTIAVLALGLASCTPADPSAAVARDDSKKWETTGITPYPVGKPFTLDGCKIQLYRIALSTNLADVTLSTVDCPTAHVSASSQACGKNCVSNNIAVRPGPPG